MKFNFPIAEPAEEKNRLSVITSSLDNKSLTGLRVSVCQIVLSFVIVNICQYRNFKMSLLVDCINPFFSQADDISLS